MLRVVAIVSRDEHETTEPGVDKLAMTALSTRHANETRSFQVGNKLADFARHMPDVARGLSAMPAV